MPGRQTGLFVYSGSTSIVRNSQIAGTYWFDGLITRLKPGPRYSSHPTSRTFTSEDSWFQFSYVDEEREIDDSISDHVMFTGRKATVYQPLLRRKYRLAR